MPKEAVQKEAMELSPSCPIQCPGMVLFRNSCTAELQCGEARICWQLIKDTVPALVLHPVSPDRLVHIWLPYEKVFRIA